MKTIAALLLLLLLAGCAAPADAQNSDTQEEPTESASTQADETDDAQEQDAGLAQAEDAEESVDSDSVAQVDIQIYSESVTQEDGVELMEVSEAEITVSVPGKPEVEESIRADLRNFLERESEAVQQLKGSAQEDYRAATEEELEWTPYEFSLQVQVTRCDEQVLSFRFIRYQNSGGVNDSIACFGRSYDMASGSRLTLDFMSAQGASLRDTGLEQVQAQVQTEEYQSLLFESGYDEDCLADVVQDETFYLDDQGIVFMASPSLIGPSSSGVIEFDLSYAALQGVMKENYLPAEETAAD